MKKKEAINSLDERLEKHPDLKRRFEQILDIVEDENDKMGNAHQVEFRAIEELRKLGNQVLQDWAERKSRQKTDEFKENNRSSTYHQKKSSGGTPPSEKSKHRK